MRSGSTGADSRGLFERGIPQTAFGAVVGLLFTSMAQGRGLLPPSIVVTLAGTALLGAAAYAINRSLLGVGGGIAGSIYAPAGARTPYTPTFSHIDALEARGAYDQAARAWATACVEHAENPMVLVRAADFQLRTIRNPRAAHDLYRRARSLDAGSPDLRRYVAQKLIDLYLGPLDDRGRAMTELRRLIETFPGTREAEWAREALARLKAEDA